MTYGVIDVGSNTIRLCIYDIADGKIKSLFNNKNTAGLIGYVNDGELSKRGIRKACDVLNEQKEMAQQAKVEKLYAFATASLRNISNSKEAVREIRRRTGLDIDVLSGIQEAALDFKGASHACSLKDGIMVDIGGGSTEILLFKDGKIKDACSIGVGSLLMYKMYVSKLFPTKSERRAIIKKVNNELKKVEFLKKGRFDTMIGIGGTIRALKKLNNDFFGYPQSNDRIDMKNMGVLLEELGDEEKQTLRKILRAAPERIHTLIPGLLILDTIRKEYKCREIIMSSFGVREGYLYAKAVEMK